MVYLPLQTQGHHFRHKVLLYNSICSMMMEIKEVYFIISIYFIDYNR